MLKADAYGHGIITIANMLTNTKCDYFGVASIEEGVLLRKNNITKKIIIFSGFFHSNQVEIMIKNDLIPMIFNNEQFNLLKENNFFTKNKNCEI